MKIPACLTSHRRHTALTLTLAALFASQSAQAVTTTWIGNAGAGNTDLATATNWFINTLPLNGHTLNFNNAGTSGTVLTNTLTNAAFNVQGINFGGSAYTLSGNTFTLTGDLNNNVAQIQTLNLDLILGSNRNLTNTLSTGNLVINGVISGAFNANFSGLGTTTLSQSVSNTYGAASGNATAVSGGSTLILDFANLSVPADLIKTGSTLQLGSGTTGGGGTLLLKGKAGAGITTAQTLGNVAVNNYATSIVLKSNSGDGTTLNLGTISRLTGNSSLNIDLSEVNTALNCTTPVGILGYATVKDASGAGFASASGATLTRLTGQTALAADSNGATTDFISTGSMMKSAGAFAVNSLTLDASGGAGDLDLAGSTMTLTQRGLLSTGENAFTVSNGQVGAFNTELIIHTMGTGGLTISGTLGNTTQPLIKNGPDVLTLSGTNAYTGTTILNGGTLKAGSTQAFGVNSAFTLSNNAGAVLDITGFDNSIGTLNGSGPSSVVIGSNTLTIGGNNANASFSGIISGSGTLTKTGTGTQILSGANALTSGSAIQVLQGQITTSSSAALGSAVVNLGDTTAGNSLSATYATTSPVIAIINVRAGSSGTLAIGSGNNQTLSGTVTLGTGTTPQNVTFTSNNGTSSGGVIGFGAAVTGYGNFLILNNQVSSGSRYTLLTTASTFNQVGTISNVSTGTETPVRFQGVIKENVTGLIQNSTAEILQISSTSPLFKGDTTVAAGILNLTNALALPNSVLAMNGGTVTLGSSISSGLSAVTFGGLAGAGDVNLNNTLTVPTAVALTIGNSNTSNGSGTNPNTLNPTYSGILSNTNGSATLTKVGTNTQTLSGANTYSGLTTINGGTLRVTNTTGSGLGTGNVTLGTAGTLSGTGTISGEVAAAGTIAPGTTGAGTLTSGALTLSGSLVVQVDAGIADQLLSTGAVVLTNATLDVSELNAGTQTSYVIAQGTSLSGTFTTTNLPAGYSVTYNGTQAILNQAVSSGNYATWATANEISGEPASGDFDNDGLTNLVEYALGKSPTLSSQPAGILANGEIIYAKGGDAIANNDVIFEIQESTDLGISDPWETVVTGGTEDEISYTLPTTGPKEFARLKVTQIP